MPAGWHAKFPVVASIKIVSTVALTESHRNLIRGAVPNAEVADRTCRTADEVRELLAFDPSTAGGMMNTEFVFVGEGSRREEVLAWVRGLELNLDQLDTIVLLDGKAEYSGTVSIARLLLAAPEQKMSELRSEPLLSIAGDADEKDVFELFDKYNLRMLTVVDEEKRPIGTVTVDDVVSRLVKK